MNFLEEFINALENFYNRENENNQSLNIYEVY